VGMADEVQASSQADTGKLTSLVNRLIKSLHTGDLFASTIDQPLYAYLRAHLEDAVQIGFGVADEKLRGYLLANVQRFSGFKTAAVQRAMSEKLTDEKGQVRPFADFKADCLEINQQYNVDYLRTEYNQAIASSQMAAKWSEFDPSSQIRYDTVGDDRVREEHVALDGITRPVNDPFWDDHYPPLDWNCRCSTTELDGDAPSTADLDLPGLPEAAEGFRENVGKTGQIFGADHPYFQLSAHEARQIEQQL
jgi:SPP1 gp7 family putative phage head morphogenesis protein